MIDASTIIFAIALLGIVGMILLKIGEVRGGKKSLLSRMGDSTDQHVHSAYDRVRYAFRYINKKSAIALVQWIAFHFLSVVHEVYKWMYDKAHRHPHSKRVIDMVRGRGEVNNNGGSSFYLKQISADGPKPGEAANPENKIEDVSVSEPKVAENPEK
jgi:hypothetical protein